MPIEEYNSKYASLAATWRKKPLIVAMALVVGSAMPITGFSQTMSHADLSGWQKQGPAEYGNWEVSSDKKFVVQTINKNPTFFVSPNNFINGIVRGSFEVYRKEDDDFIGFVFGYKSPIDGVSSSESESTFLLFDWKRLDQAQKITTGKAGYNLSQIDQLGTFDNRCFWGRENKPPHCNVLASDYGTNKGWEFGTKYWFELNYRTDRIIIKVGEAPNSLQTIFDVNGNFEPGRFGFYNFSQPYVRYGDFTFQGDPPVAKKDTYGIESGKDLNVIAAKGVLANDSTATLNKLTVELGKTTNHGTLSLKPDGSFTYTPNFRFYGFDSFTYRIFDGGQYSNYATVTIEEPAACATTNVASILSVDNLYKLYHGNSEQVHYVEQGGLGKFGETSFSPNNDDYIYVVAWSDHKVAQGFVGEFTSGDETVLTGNPAWQVYATNAGAPSIDTQLLESIKKADAENEWTSTFVGPSHSTGSWGEKTGIADEAKWIWYDSGNCPSNSSPLIGDCNHDEYLIFRLPVSKLSNCPQYRAYGRLLNDEGDPIVGAAMQVGNKTVTTDAAGNWEIPGLFEGEYTVTASKEGYILPEQSFEVGQGEHAEIKFKPQSMLSLSFKPSTHKPIKQGSNITYTAIVTNKGDSTATGANLEYLLPEGMEVVSMSVLEGNSCDTSTATCTLPDLTPGASVKVEIVAKAVGAGTLVNQAQVSGDNYPTDSAKRWTRVNPFFSVTPVDTPDPVEAEGALHYSYEVDLNEFADKAATNIQFATQLPRGTSLQAINTTQGTCDISALPKVSCDLDELDNSTAESISHATIAMDVQVDDSGWLLLVNEASVTSADYPTHRAKARTKVVLSDDVALDMAIVVDTTNSMTEERNGVVVAIQEFIDAKVTGNIEVALIEFKDEANLGVATHDMVLLKQKVTELVVEGGGMCPEASVESLDVAVELVKEGGHILFVTDASPYEDADVEGLTQRIKDKSIKLTTIITGDCSDGETSWNDVAAEQAAN